MKLLLEERRNLMKKLRKPKVKNIVKLYGEGHGGNCSCAGA